MFLRDFRYEKKAGPRGPSNPFIFKKNHVYALKKYISVDRSIFYKFTFSAIRSFQKYILKIHVYRSEGRSKKYLKNLHL